MILAVAVGLGIVVIGGFVYLQSNKTKQNAEAPKSNLGNVIPVGAEDSRAPMSEATRAMLDRVQKSEADEARRKGRSYIPENYLGKGEPVDAKPDAKPVVTSQPSAAPSGIRPGGDQEGAGVNSYQQYQARQNGQNNPQNAEMQMIQDGLIRQMELVTNSMKAPTMQVVAIKPQEKQKFAENGMGSNGGNNGNVQGAENVAKANKGPELVGADEIVAAIITTPIDTDTTKFVMGEIVGGRLNGAVLRGEVVPLNQSGDVEDVGVRFTSLRLKDKAYAIDAIALNESTANNAMSGDVDRRVFSRYVMPIVMASLSGVSTYFSALGTPAVSLATGTNPGSTSVIVNQNAIGADQAMQQGIGSAVNAGVQTGNKAVAKMANRPNRVTLPAMTPIGVMFNAPVYVNAAK